MDGNIISKRERDFIEEDRNHIGEVIENTVVNYIEEILKEKELDISQIEKIGIAAPGTHKNGIIVKAENLGIKDFKIVEGIKKHFDKKDIILNNDAKCAAMCEKSYGSLKEYDDAVFIGLGTGIGGAVFLSR